MSISKRKKIRNGILMVVLLLLLSPFLLFFGICQKGKTGLKVSQDEAAQTVIWNGKEYQYREGLVNILCLGIDRATDLTEYDISGNRIQNGQSDAILLVSIDTENAQIRVLAVPRDTMVTLSLYSADGLFKGNMDGQITLQYAYGDGVEQSCELVRQRTEELLFNIPIQRYAAINLRAIATINDAVGGVELTMSEDYTDIDPDFEEGATIRLEGEQALNFIRRRDTGVAGSAFTRLNRQKQYMSAFAAQAKEAVRSDITMPIYLLKALEPDMLTDISADEMLYLLTEAADLSLSGEDVYILPEDIVGGKIYEEYEPDEEEIRQLVLELFYEEE